MKKMKFGFFVIGFLVGIIYVAACGGASQSIADAIGSGLEIVFDNSSSGLAANNVQEAIDEMAVRLDELEGKAEDASKTNVGEMLIGTWKGSEFREFHYDGFEELSSEITITFNIDGSYTCSNSVYFADSKPSICSSSGTWTQKGMYIVLKAENGGEILTIGSISEQYLITNEDDMNVMNVFWVLTRQ